ncbi:helix-turn-helix domain-containing protein [Rhizobium sp. CRIBSB]|nr:helix-turn-helix domain-containing protein [Rhizobium sp. CRIBSB]
MFSNNHDSHAKAVLTVDEFCETCSIGRTSFYAGVQSGHIKVLKFGKRTLIPASEVQAFLERLSAVAR